MAEGFFDGQEAAEVDEFEQAEFEVEALLLSVPQFVEGAEHGLQEAGELLFAEECGGAGGAALLVGGDLEEFAAEAGDGSMRDALSIMDQAIASAPMEDGVPRLDAAQIRELMGTVPNTVFERML